MRFIYKILLGMFIFNAMLLFLAGFFTVQDVEPIVSSGAVNVTSEYSGWTPSGASGFLSILFSDANSGGVLGGIGIEGLFAAILGIVGLGLLLVTKNYILAGACFFSAFVVLVFNATKNVVFNISAFSNSWVIEGMYGLVTICIGILAVYTIIDMFTGQQEAF